MLCTARCAASQTVTVFPRLKASVSPAAAAPPAAAPAADVGSAAETAVAPVPVEEADVGSAAEPAVAPVPVEEEDHDKEDEAFVKELLLHTTKFQLLEHTPREPRNHAARRMRWHGKKLLCSTPNCEFQ